MSDNLELPLTYEWLHEHGFHKLERLERQAHDHVRRCLGRETVETTRLLSSEEDLCLDLTPNRMPDPDWWFCWVTRASSQNHHPSVWIHTRQLVTRFDLVLLYMGLTGRHFGKPDWDRRKLMKPVELNKPRRKPVVWCGDQS